jgi:hypothetical protein
LADNIIYCEPRQHAALEHRVGIVVEINVSRRRQHMSDEKTLPVAPVGFALVEEALSLRQWRADQVNSKERKRGIQIAYYSRNMELHKW